jgi:hypothetical protein
LKVIQKGRLAIGPQVGSRVPTCPHGSEAASNALANARGSFAAHHRHKIFASGEEFAPWVTALRLWAQKVARTFSASYRAAIARKRPSTFKGDELGQVLPGS